MDKWEYMFVMIDKWNPENTLKALNESGRQGWEVVSHFWGRFTFVD